MTERIIMDWVSEKAFKRLLQHPEQDGPAFARFCTGLSRAQYCPSDDRKDMLIRREALQQFLDTPLLDGRQVLLKHDPVHGSSAMEKLFGHTSNFLYQHDLRYEPPVQGARVETPGFIRS